MADEEEKHGGSIYGHEGHGDHGSIFSNERGSIEGKYDSLDTFGHATNDDIFGNAKSDNVLGQDRQDNTEGGRGGLFDSPGSLFGNQGSIFGSNSGTSTNTGYNDPPAGPFTSSNNSYTAPSSFAAPSSTVTDPSSSLPSPSAPPLPLDEGRYVPLKDNSWEAQAALVKDPHNKLGFDTSRPFDGVVAVKSGIRGLYDPSSPDYARYEGLRTNLAVLRNTLLASGMDPARMQSIAEALGEGLAHSGNWVQRTYTNWLCKNVANVESVGASEMYKYLLEIQQKPGVLEGARKLFGRLAHDPDRAWGLPRIEETPFSASNLATPSSLESRYGSRVHHPDITPLSRV